MYQPWLDWLAMVPFSLSSCSRQLPTIKSGTFTKSETVVRLYLITFFAYLSCHQNTLSYNCPFFNIAVIILILLSFACYFFELTHPPHSYKCMIAAFSILPLLFTLLCLSALRSSGAVLTGDYLRGFNTSVQLVSFACRHTR